MGLLGPPGAAGARLALRRPDRVAARGDRARGDVRPVRRAGLHHGATGRVGWTDFRDRFGMPFAPSPKARVSATARACRAIVAARILAPGSEWAVLRALQLANFTSPLLLDDDDPAARGARRASRAWSGDAVVARLDDPEVTEAYERDRAEARTAAGSPTELQGKTATTDGPVRYTAPSVVFAPRRPEPGGGRLADDRGLRRRSSPTSPPTSTGATRPTASLRSSSASPRGSPPRRSRRSWSAGNDSLDRKAAERLAHPGRRRRDRDPRPPRRRRPLAARRRLSLRRSRGPRRRPPAPRRRWWRTPARRRGRRPCWRPPPGSPAGRAATWGGARR